TIPWKKLPKLKAVAPEYYNTLKTHASYPGLLLRFIVDPNLHLKKRVLRKAQKPVEATSHRVAEAQIPSEVS
ncbi:MAG: fatty acid desaturase, partial [Bdellovibrionales bacterium]|nr:fatty acid desaturase [Oligoflexia bacterium]